MVAPWREHFKHIEAQSDMYDQKGQTTLRQARELYLLSITVGGQHSQILTIKNDNLISTQTEECISIVTIDGQFNLHIILVHIYV